MSAMGHLLTSPLPIALVCFVPQADMRQFLRVMPLELLRPGEKRR
jgi:hypothetical protein